MLINLLANLVLIKIFKIFNFTSLSYKLGLKIAFYYC